MEIQIRFHGVDHSPAFARHATRRIEQYLGRLGPQVPHTVARVLLRVTRPGTPSEGDEVRCHLAASGPDLGAVLLVEARGEPYSAVELALYRMRQALGSALRATAPEPG